VKGRARFVGFLITGVFLVLALRNVDLGAVAQQLATADYRLLLPAAACTLGSYLLRTTRWRVLLEPVFPVSWRAAFSALMLGFAANNVLPARVGEVVRAYTLSRTTGASVSLGFATIVVERLFDGLTLLALMAVALRFAPIPADGEQLRLVEVASVAIFAAAALVLTALLLLRRRALVLVGIVTRPLPATIATRIGGIAESFIDGLDCLRRPSVIARAAGLSVLVWTCEAASYAFVARAFDLGLSPAQYLSAVLFLVVFVNLGIMIPSAPGYIGTFQFFARLALAPFGVPAAQALSLAVLAHATQYALVTGIGLVILWRQHLSFGRITGAAAAADIAAD
jgi:uncharacterized protein (TIRG00374 family)